MVQTMLYLNYRWIGQLVCSKGINDLMTFRCSQLTAASGASEGGREVTSFASFDLEMGDFKI
jgi:hypothetical protein